MFDFIVEPKQNKENINLNTVYDVIVIGAGPGGLNASLYAKRKGLSVIVVAKESGGQLLNTNQIDNYLGFNEISGEKLNTVFIDHLKAFNIPLFLNTSIKKLEKIDDLFYLTLENKDIIKTKTVVLATGGSPRKLNAKNEQKFIGYGISYCAICDGPFYQGKNVVVVGGGNSALEAAIDLAKIAAKVTIIQLLDHFTADQILIDQIKSTANITYILNSEVVEFNGKNTVSEIIYFNNTNKREETLKLDGAFIEIGVIPNSNLVKDIVELNAFNEIIVNSEQKTSLEGLYAVGDVTNFSYKQIITAVSQGAVAALSLNNYINRRDKK